MIEYENKYSQYLRKFTNIENSISEDKLNLVEISIMSILGKRILKSWLFTNECLGYLINKDIDKLPDWLIRLINIEINRRKDLITLKNSFLKIKHDHELAEILGMNYGTLVYHIFKVPDERKYKIFKIPKKSGGFRTLCSPISNIKLIQKKLSEILNEIYIPRINTHGFIQGRGIVSNAKIHVKQKAILNIDIKDFFPTINFGRVRGLFLNKPFYFPEWIATLLAQICTYQNQLPQGSPVSPIISNMICSKLDNRISTLSKKYYCYFTRYADDITLSTNKYDFPTELIRQIRVVVEEEGFNVNDNKFRIQKKNQRKEVTGITVNKKLNVKRKYIRKIRAMLSSWEKYGYENANHTFNKKIRPTYPHIRFLPRLDNSLHGMIDYVGQVRGKEDFLYNKLLIKYKKLAKQPLKMTRKIPQGKIQEQTSNNSNSKKELNTVKARKKHNINIIHDPLSLSNVLMLFKKTGPLKDLVHETIDNINLKSIVKKAKNELENNKHKLPFDFYINIKENLIKVYLKNGIKYWEINNEHPYNTNNDFTNIINDFKKTYRFGRYGNDETNLYDELLKILNDPKNRRYQNKFEINEQIKQFDFYGDVQHILHGIKIIINSVDKYFKKKLEVNYNQKFDDFNNRKVRIITLSIINIDTQSQQDSTELTYRFQNYLHSLPELADKNSSKGHLFSRCDWYIEADFPKEGLKRLKILDIHNPNIVMLDEENPIDNKGFTHILKFYEYLD